MRTNVSYNTFPWMWMGGKLRRDTGELELKCVRARGREPEKVCTQL